MNPDLAAQAARDEAELAATPAKHEWTVPHEPRDCPPHSEGHCMWCEGGLMYCAKCSAFEGATTTECPLREVDTDTWDAVYAGLLDFRQGAWQLRPTRWIETAVPWQNNLPAAELQLRGLPPVVSVGHFAAFGPSTERSWCLPTCADCITARERALEAYRLLKAEGKPRAAGAGMGL